MFISIGDNSEQHDSNYLYDRQFKENSAKNIQIVKDQIDDLRSISHMTDDINEENSESEIERESKEIEVVNNNLSNGQPVQIEEVKPKKKIKAKVSKVHKKQLARVQPNTKIRDDIMRNNSKLDSNNNEEKKEPINSKTFVPNPIVQKVDKPEKNTPLTALLEKKVTMPTRPPPLEQLHIWLFEEAAKGLST